MIRFLKNLLLRNRKERDLDEEVKACLELLAEEASAAGMRHEEALHSAHRRFGGPEQVKDAVRDVRAGEELQRCWQDLRCAWRTLSKSRGFTIAAISILTIGIGANTALFSVVDAVLLRPLPYRAPEQLIRIRQALPRMGEMQLGAAPPEFVSYRDRTRVFSSVAGYQDASYDVTGFNQPDRVAACKATASLFDTLDVRPHIGRAFTRADEAIEAAPVVLISYSYWVRHYGADPGVLNKMVYLNDAPYRIVGVMPRGFAFPAGEITPGAPPALWLPLVFSADDLKDWASSYDTSVIARLPPGTTLARAQADVSRVARLFQRENRNVYSGSTVLEASVEPWKSDLNSRIPGMLRILSLAVGVVLLIACANVGNLVLARMTERAREISIRRALGASGARLARQVLSETAILAGAAALFGSGLAIAILRCLQNVWSADLNFRDITVNGRALLFTAAISCGTCLLCGALPSIARRKQDLHSMLRQAGQQMGTGERRALSNLLLCTEVASSVVLLLTAALLLGSFEKVVNVPLGFDPDNVLIVRTSFNGERYASYEKRRSLEREILTRLGSLRGVKSTALTTHVPLADERQIGFTVEGASEDDAHWADNAIVSGNYFSTMGTRLLRGRTFTNEDTPGSPKVALVNESMATRFWRGSDPDGKAFFWGGRRFQVIGVLQDVHVSALDRAVGPAIYFDAFQMENHVLSSGVFILRTAANVNVPELSASVRKTIWSIDPAIPILGFSTLNEVVSSSLATRRASLLLAISFAAIACALAAAGIYSVFSQAVSQQVREIGVRLALGAQPNEIRNRVLLQGLRLILYGAFAGFLASLLGARLFWGSLAGMSAFGPIPYLASAAVLAPVALLGMYAPARRASRVDPMLALRAE